MAVFRGNTEGCFRHFIEVAKAPHLDKREALSKFMGVPIEPTIRRWFKGETSPQGEYLVQVRYFLEILGYEVAELEKLNPIVRKTGRIIAYRLKAIGEVAEMLGYSSKQKSGQMLVVLHGVGGLSTDKLKKAETLVETMHVTLEQETARRKLALRIGKSEAKQTNLLAARPALSAANGSGLSNKKLMLEAAAHFVSGLIPIADYLLSDSCSEEDRKKLHDLAGADSVLKLTTRLRRLCSETARRQLKDI
jgi:hypothetical protein